MKKCPTCGKEFEDSMKFCQIDGTALEAAAEEPAFDPYATMVSTPSKPIAPPEEPSAPEPAGQTSMSSVPIAEPDDVLDLPEVDPLKTMMVSSEELQQAMGGRAQPEEEPVLETPEPEAPAMPTPPEFITPEVEDPPTVPSYGEMPTPPSPFSEPEPQPSYDQPTPSYNEPAPAAPVWDEPATMIQTPADIPFEPPAPVQEWTPPPAPDAQWQNQQIGSQTPFQPPPAGVGGQNKTLPIVSLVLGILSVCCYVSPIMGIAALITGWLGLKNIKSDPHTYGGKGLAMAGMIMGGLFFIVGIVYWIFILFFGGLAMIMDATR
jgi:hypothetical protein